MSASILVAYVTKYGSTHDVAVKIADTLRDQGISVDVKVMKDVRSIREYGAVVMGSPIYMGHWMPSVDRFLTQHRDELEQRPVAIFTLGMMNADPGTGGEAADQFDQELARYPWIHSISTVLLGGKYDPSHLSLTHKLMAAMPGTPLHGRPAHDARDWEIIHSWTTALSAKLNLATAA